MQAGEKSRIIGDSLQASNQLSIEDTSYRNMMALIITSNFPVKHTRDRRQPQIRVTADLKQNNFKVGWTPPSKSTRFTFKDEAMHNTGTNYYTSSSEPSANKSELLVPWRSFYALSMAFCNALEEMIDTVSSDPSADPSHAFSGNFAPVNELAPTRCPVISGNIPKCLIGGAYIRNGPNPQYLSHRSRHIFDGDGMLHSLLLSNEGHATFCSRYVRTHKYMLERNAGGPIIPGLFSSFYGFQGIARGAITAFRILIGQINLARGIGLANTSLMYLARVLYALGESDLPYAMHVDPATGEISTLGRCNFGGRLKIAMTAHPKKDPKTGETFAFRCGLVPPFLSYFRFDNAGNKSDDVPIFSIRQPSLVHDFVITENYVLFLDSQIVIKPLDMVIRRSRCVGSDHRKVPRLGVLPRNAMHGSQIKWFDVPGFNMIHAINSWEEKNVKGEECLVLVAPNLLGIEHALEDMEIVHCCVEMVRINLSTKVVSRIPLSAQNLEFGVINPSYVGRKNRYAYLGVGDPNPKIAAIVKLDLSQAGRGDCVVASRNFGPGCFGGEPFFVPKNNGKEEDDGYLMCYVHNEMTGESKFIVMDACSSNLEIVAEVLLPQRVPYGFHGLFVSKSELDSQYRFL